MTNDGACPFCSSTLKTSAHVIRECSFARLVWQSVVPINLQSWFFHYNSRNGSHGICNTTFPCEFLVLICKLCLLSYADCCGSLGIWLFFLVAIGALP